MTEFLPETQSLVLMSDIDEIPSAHTVELLRVCDFGSSLHLQMRNYLYRLVVEPFVLVPRKVSNAAH